MKISIRNWSSIFELSDAKRTSKGTPLKWIAIPTKHDGRGLRRLLAMECGTEVFGAFILLCEVAAKMPVRGVLADEDGDLSLEDLSLKTGGSIKSFQKAIELLTDKEVKICWLTTEGEILKDTSGYSGVAPLRTYGRTIRDGTKRSKDLSTNPPAAVASGNGELKEKPKKEPTPRKLSTGPHAELIEHFVNRWESQYGTKYVFAAKDGVAAAKILTGSGGDLAKAMQIIDTYLACNDPFIADQRHPLPLLRSQINRFTDGKPPTRAESAREKRDREIDEALAAE